MIKTDQVDCENAALIGGDALIKVNTYSYHLHIKKIFQLYLPIIND